MLIPEDGDSSSEEDQEMVDFRNEKYTRDDVDSEAPQQAPKEIPEETPEQSGAPAAGVWCLVLKPGGLFVLLLFHF